MRLAVLLGALLASAPGPLSAAEPRDTTRAPAENDYYRLSAVPIPEGVVLEVGGLETLPDGRLAVSTRRGEVWIVENPSLAGGALPHYSLFASGLHEPLGLAYRDGALYMAQRGELTRLRDLDGDGRADRYEALATWPLSGNYHEYSFGPVFAPNGDMIVTLNLGWIGYGASLARWRGWALRITPDGEVTPFATGLRSPAGFAFNLDGDLFYAENQGDWVGSGGISVMNPGDFEGNPAGLRWTDDPRSPIHLRPEDIPDTDEPKFEVAKRVKGLRTPAVWFPHGVMGISTSGMLVDSTRGAFGPFAGQFFVGDQGQSKVMRVFLEKVDGVYQGAVFPFREGFASGVLREVWGTDGSMYVGMTSRGWDATGRAPYGLQRLVWTGKTPFEAQKAEARPDGFEITFTKPIYRAAASDPSLYHVSSFIYQYHHEYGSPIIGLDSLRVRGVSVSRDARSVRIAVDGLREGYIHEIHLGALSSADGVPLLHDVMYYTLNRIPRGVRMKLSSRAAAAPAAPPRAPAEGAAPAAEALAKHLTTAPAAWGGRVDRTLGIRALSGLPFDTERLEARPGERVSLALSNTGDMLHNFVVTRPGRADAVASAAMQMGIQGPQHDFVPESEDVLFHTSLLQPQGSETIYFLAPSRPGDYPFICSFPGHATSMRGVLHVAP
jgi:uncharacterized cupredoxin-like copper-binding protein/glucose/arabinose dehydrogenase